jgi:hypothetical protein
MPAPPSTSPPSKLRAPPCISKSSSRATRRCSVRRQLAPLVLKVPGEHAVQTREAPEPASAKPAVQLHEAEASTLVLPAGHAVQDVSPALLYVSTPQAGVAEVSCMWSIHSRARHTTQRQRTGAAQGATGAGRAVASSTYAGGRASTASTVAGARGACSRLGIAVRAGQAG